MQREQAPLRIRLRQSRILLLYSHLLHAGLTVYCVMALLTVTYPLAMLPPIGGLAASWYLLARKACGRVRQSSIIVWTPEGNWMVEEAGATRHYPCLNNCFNTHWLTILGFRYGCLRRRYYLLLADNCDPEQRRRLRVRLNQQFSRPAREADSCPGSAP